jgi:LEA14-like dessication related protein
MQQAMFRCVGGVLLVLLAGCAGMMTRLERPEVTVAGIDLIEPGLLEQRYRIQLRVHNPNDVDLPVDGVRFRVDINGHSFVTGESPAAVTVPRFGSALMEVDAVSTLASFARQFGDISSGRTLAVRYELSGNVHLSHPPVNLPFTQEGEIGLPGATGTR